MISDQSKNYFSFYNSFKYEYFKFFYGKYPNQESIRAVCNINNKQYKKALEIAKKEMGDL